MRPSLALLALALLPLTAVAQVAPAEDLPGTELDIEGIEVTGGSLALRRASYVKAGSGRLAVLSGTVNMGGGLGRTVLKGGSITLSDDSRFNADRSTIEITGGNLQFRNGSLFHGDNSTISITGGSLLGFDQSSFRLGGGSVVFTDSVSPTFTDSSFRVSGGNLTLKGKAGTRLDTGSTLTINDGNFDLYDSSSFFAAGGSSIEMSGGNLLLNDTSSLSLTGGSCLFAGRSTLTLKPGSALSAREFSCSSIVVVTVRVGGKLALGPDSTFELAQSILALEPAGSLSIDESAVVTPTRGSTLTVPDGAIGIDTLAALDTACVGTAAVIVDREGRTTLTCDGPATSTEYCKASAPKDTTPRGTCSYGSDRKVGICCR